MGNGLQAIHSCVFGLAAHADVQLLVPSNVIAGQR